MFSIKSSILGTYAPGSAYPLPVHTLLRRAGRILVGYALFCVLAGVAVSELSLHLHRRPLPPPLQATAVRISTTLGAKLESVQISASDRIPLRAWTVIPAKSNGNTVLL